MAATHVGEAARLCRVLTKCLRLTAVPAPPGLRLGARGGGFGGWELHSRAGGFPRQFRAGESLRRLRDHGRRWGRGRSPPGFGQAPSLVNDTPGPAPGGLSTPAGYDEQVGRRARGPLLDHMRSRGTRRLGLSTDHVTAELAARTVGGGCFSNGRPASVLPWEASCAIASRIRAAGRGFSGIHARIGAGQRGVGRADASGCLLCR